MGQLNRVAEIDGLTRIGPDELEQRPTEDSRAPVASPNGTMSDKNE